MASTFNLEGLSTRDVVADTLILGGKIVHQIVDDHTATDADGLASTVALFNGLAELESKFETLLDDATGASKVVRSIFSNSIVSSTFVKLVDNPILGWEYSVFVRVNDTASLTNDGLTYTTSNYLGVPRGRYPEKGNYFLHLVVPEISGKLSIMLNGVSVGEITSVGTHSLAIDITNATSDILRLVGSNVDLGKSIVLSGAYLVRVRDELKDYVQHLIDVAIGIQKQEFVTTTTLTAAIAQATASMQASLLAHKQQRNPHGTTYADVGAAAETHTHSEYLTKAELTSLGNQVIKPDVILSGERTVLNVPNITHPYQIFKALHLTHNSSGQYSETSGRLTVSHYCKGDVGDMVNVQNAIADRGVQIWKNTQSPIVTYDFVTSRKLKQLVIVSKESAEANRPTKVTAAYGAHSIEIDISADITTVDLDSTDEVASIKLTLAHGSETTPSYLHFGFDLVFADTSDKVLLLNDGLVYTTVVDGTVTTYTTPKLEIDPDLYGTKYTVSLLDNETLELTTVHYPYSEGIVPYSYPLANMTTQSSAAYGSIDITNIATISLGLEYTIYQESPKITYVASSAVYAHTFPSAKTIHHIDLISSHNDLSVSVILQLADTTTTSVDASAITVTYDPVTGLFTHHLALDVSILKYTISVSRQSTDLLTSMRMEVAQSVVWFNTSTRKWSDDQVRKVFGRVIVMNDGRAILEPCAQDVDIVIPLNGLFITQVYEEIEIYNPFYTTDVGIRLYPMDCVSAQISTEKILITCGPSNAYTARLTRQW